MTDNADLDPAELEAAGALGGSEDPGYQWPTDPLVVKNLKHWQDLTFGVIVHWGIYSAIGQGGSWSLHRDDLGWFTDKAPQFPGDPNDDAGYQDWYYDQAKTFRGEDFDASEWAHACADAGLTYCVFTTKHHDGFCMYDSGYTNLKATSESSGLRRDILREVVDAFRGAGLETGAYFSKADWSHACYWVRSKRIHDRFHNYDLEAQPERWQRFVDFTMDQITEILSNYGPMNVLWLDAGWVSTPEEPIGIDDIATRAREIQPGIIVVDRAVHGPHENYRTPEQEIPEDILDYPWEACLTLTKEWCSLSPDDPAKPTSLIIANLIKIVSRGGNYLLGIGPDATGHMPDSVRRGLREIGGWMDVCGEGIWLLVLLIPKFPLRATTSSGISRRRIPTCSPGASPMRMSSVRIASSLKASTARPVFLADLSSKPRPVTVAPSSRFPLLLPSTQSDWSSSSTEQCDLVLITYLEGFPCFDAPDIDVKTRSLNSAIGMRLLIDGRRRGVRSRLWVSVRISPSPPRGTASPKSST